LPLADDPDAGVRRELILAIRNLPTDQVGDALRTLVRTWDGRDRWYLEALGLALDRRESDYLARLFDGTLFGNIDPARDGRATGLALPPYFPVDRNEAYIEVGAKDLPASALSKTLGLAWRLHRPEALPLLGRLLPALTAPDLQQAADDALGQVRDPEAAVVLAGLATKADDPARKRQLLESLAAKVESVWQDARRRPEVAGLVATSLKDPELRLEAVRLAAATEDPRYAPALADLSRDPKASEPVRAAAVEAAARLDDPKAGEFLAATIEQTKGAGSSNAAVEAAVRSLPRVGDPRPRLLALIAANEYPLGVRREALRTLAGLGDGPNKLIALARDGKLPADLKTEATTVLATHPERKVRDRAAQVLPLPRTRGGRPLPSFGEMVRKEGRADRGREIFFRQPEAGVAAVAGATACGNCHRVQGRGQWVGPDLSTIGTKYGRDELLRSILNPSAAIGYNFRTMVVGLDDGRVVTGLPVEDTPDRLVLKTADGQRVALRPNQVEQRKNSDVSLMPEGLAETMSDQDLADLLSFLSTLRQPVSVVGQYQVVGPLAEKEGAPALDTGSDVDLSATLRGPEGQKLAWRRLDADAEGRADLTTLVGNGPARAAYLYAPVVSPLAQQARLVVESKADVKAWLNGKPVALPDAGADGARALVVDLPAGKNGLLLRVDGAPGAAAVVTTFVTDAPLAFRADEVKDPAK
jgi:putative heme-binding domain-containing protein